MTFLDSFLLAQRTVRSNKLRTGITVTIIAFGIMALIGIITAINAMNKSLTESFSTMGANGFSISYKERFRVGMDNNKRVKIDKRKKQKKSNLDKPILINEAENFKKFFTYPSVISIGLSGRGGNEIGYKGKKTNPNIQLRGGDENYLQVNGFTLVSGRNFNMLDVETGRNVCVLGNSAAKKLFGDNPEIGVDKMITVGNYVYRVIGVLKAKGSSALLRADDVVITTYNNIRRLSGNAKSFTINVDAGNVNMVDGAIAEATAVLRGVRKLHPTEDDNFVIEKSDKLAQTFIGLLSSISFAAAAIGLITLFGAAIGLMNIMLVAVNERTREIGLIKAIGGKKKNIRQQFLFESMIISLAGAFFGILLGVILGNGFAFFLNTGFVVPWLWVISGIIICAGVGLIAGLWPAVKAARLNPINALRYE